jgi:mannose-6-phosphate isomerase-like protein (cupin superfamily)
MNITAYIQTGIIQDYCLGLLSEEEMGTVREMAKQFPEISAAIKTTEEALEEFALKHSFLPKQELKEETWQLISNLEREKNFSTDDTPIINKFSDYKKWMEVMRPLLPAAMEEEVFAKVIREDGKVTQTLIKTKIDYPDEVHEEVYESFIVLEGECECYIGDRVVKLGPGGFIDIPLHEHHDVKLLSPYVIAVQQRIAV